MPENPQAPHDPADEMPVHGEAARHLSPPSGPVPTSETVEARNKREAEENAGASRRARTARAKAQEVEVEEDDEKYVLPTPQEAFAERHSAAVRNHARMMDKQLELQRAVRGVGEEPHTMRTMAQPKDNENYTQTEQAIENNRMLAAEAAHQILGDETRLAEMRRAYGDYAGRLFTVDPRDVNAVKTMEVRPPGEPDVVTAFPQGLSSRHVPESKTSY